MRIVLVMNVGLSKLLQLEREELGAQQSGQASYIPLLLNSGQFL